MLSQYQLVYIFQTVKSWETVYDWRFQISRGLFGLQVIFKAGLPAYKWWVLAYLSTDRNQIAGNYHTLPPLVCIAPGGVSRGCDSPLNPTIGKHVLRSIYKLPPLVKSQAILENQNQAT